MNWGLFKSFCEMLDSIPIKAVLRAVDAERKMVEDDLDKKRTERDEHVTSVLGFCNFLMVAEIFGQLDKIFPPAFDSPKNSGSFEYLMGNRERLI